jgi:predicted site-specific integrase-resolvase
VVVITEDEEKSYEEELVEDVLSVIKAFSAKLYGLKSNKNKAIVSGARKLFEKEGEDYGDCNENSAPAQPCS